MQIVKHESFRTNHLVAYIDMFNSTLLNIVTSTYQQRKTTLQE